MASPVLQLSLSWQILAGACIVLLLAIKIFKSLLSSKRNARLPPGPKGQWLLGVTKEMLDPSLKPWTRFETWSKEYGAKHLLAVPTLGQITIVVNSMQAAMDILEKRPKIYSGRPRNVFDSEIVEQSMVLANIDEPDAVARLRKLLNEDLGAQGARLASHIQQEEARKFAADLVKRPTEYLDAITESQRSLVLAMTCQQTNTLTREQLYEHIHRTQTRARPNLVPFLSIWPNLRFLPQWVPGANFKEVGLKYHEEDRKVWTSIVEDVRKMMAQGTAKHSFVSRWLQTDAGKRYGFNDAEIAFAAGNLLTAGGDLPDVTFRIFILTMLHHPEICKEAQAEIDSVVGRDRLPIIEDKDFLPYTRAVILETQRWRPLTPIGVCHTSTEDDVYDGMFIAKGMRLFPNLWAMSQDADFYPEPAKFLPERHIREDGSFTKRNELPTWGFGGRKCSAMHLAEVTLFINIATLLWAFEFIPESDEQGKPIVPSADYEDWNGTLPWHVEPTRFEEA